MGLLRRMAVIASSTAIVAGIGVAGVVTAGPASATESSFAGKLCVYTSTGAEVCATAPGSTGEDVQMPLSGYSNWFWPTSATGEIKRLDTSDCMSEDNSSVIYVACNGEQAQLWDIYLIRDNGLEAMFQNTSGKCLEYAAGAGVLDALTCDQSTNGQWFALIVNS
jgi:hypothetical protein